MDHLQSFQPRQITPLRNAEQQGWTLKRYAILSDGCSMDDDIVAAATEEAIRRLPSPGSIDDADTNHAIGFQIVHFAQVAVVSPVFYWQWGSVLAHIPQMRAPWVDPTHFADGKAEVFGCLWEMQIVEFETNCWKETVLSGTENPSTNIAAYLSRFCA